MANPAYWDRARGPRVESVQFRNDLTPAEALARVCDADGGVDIVTEVRPQDAARVERSSHARLVTVAALRSVFGLIDRDAVGLPLGDVRARRALNLAIDRARLVRDAYAGHARPVGGLVPPTPLTLPLCAPQFGHHPRTAERLWRAACGGASARALRVAAPAALDAAARCVVDDLERAFGQHITLTLLDDAAVRETRRALAARTTPRPWDLLLWQHSLQAADSAAPEFHHAIAGEKGEYRTGGKVPDFDSLFADLTNTYYKLHQLWITRKMDRFVHREALALCLCAPQALYAVRRDVAFRPYASTFELADASVADSHPSLRR